MPLSENAVLIVEDDELKLRAILKFFKDNFPRWRVTEARSLTSAIGALENTSFDVAVIDMSLPTYDMNESTMGGGNPQGFGGEDVIRFMAATGIEAKVVVVTQYDEFQDVDGGASRSLEEIELSLRAEIGDPFIGAVFYAGQHGDWQLSLLDLLANSVERKA